MNELDIGSAREILERFRGRRVLVVGDVMLDRFVWGDVDRISPEAPVPVVRVSRETTRLGGAANVAANLASLGASASVAAVVGADGSSKRLRQGLADLGVEPLLVVDPRRDTTVKTRVIAQAQQVVRVDRESDRALGESALRELVGTVRERLASAEALVISDYEKGVVTAGLLEPVLRDASRRSIPVVVDPKLVHFGAYQPITVVTPNQAEAARVTATRIATDEECLAAAETILGRIDARAVLITRGSRGMLLKERDAGPVFVPTVAREVYDVTGAGDTVVAVMALALAAGSGLRNAAWLANLAGGVVVGKVGTATVTVEELDALMASVAGGGAQGPA